MLKTINVLETFQTTSPLVHNGPASLLNLDAIATWRTMTLGIMFGDLSLMNRRLRLDKPRCSFASAGTTFAGGE